MLNAESVVNKLNELSLLIDANNPDLIIITESHCNDMIPDALISFQGFNTTRADRVVGRKGGVVLVSRSDFLITLMLCSLEWYTTGTNKTCIYCINIEYTSIHEYGHYRWQPLGGSVYIYMARMRSALNTDLYVTI